MMTNNQDNLLRISHRMHSRLTAEISQDSRGSKDDAGLLVKCLGGQNPFCLRFAPVAENIKIAPLSAYDQGCVELIQNSFSDYLQGNVDLDKAKGKL